MSDMELNKPPTDFEGLQMRRTGFDGPEEKLIYDAQNLFFLAESLSRVTGKRVDMVSLMKRKDDDVEALRKEVEDRIMGGFDGLISRVDDYWRALLKSPEVKAGAKAVITEKEPEDPRLRCYRADYDRWEDYFKSICSWDEIEKRLMSNDWRYLDLAEKMHEGGVLFGVDFNGNPLFADGGEEPIMTDMNYFDARNAVYFTEKDGRKVPTGYSMFPYIGECSKSPEITLFESFTCNPFIKSAKGIEARFSWLESGNNPSLARFARFHGSRGIVKIGWSQPQDKNSWLGVRRLLKVGVE